MEIDSNPMLLIPNASMGLATSTTVQSCEVRCPSLTPGDFPLDCSSSSMLPVSLSVSADLSSEQNSPGGSPAAPALTADDISDASECRAPLVAPAVLVPVPNDVPAVVAAAAPLETRQPQDECVSAGDTTDDDDDADVPSRLENVWLEQKQDIEWRWHWLQLQVAELTRDAGEERPKAVATVDEHVSVSSRTAPGQSESRLAPRLEQHEQQPHQPLENITIEHPISSRTPSPSLPAGPACAAAVAAAAAVVPAPLPDAADTDEIIDIELVDPAEPALPQLLLPTTTSDACSPLVDDDGDEPLPAAAAAAAARPPDVVCRVADAATAAGAVQLPPVSAQAPDARPAAPQTGQASASPPAVAAGSAVTAAAASGAAVALTAAGAAATPLVDDADEAPLTALSVLECLDSHPLLSFQARCVKEAVTARGMHQEQLAFDRELEELQRLRDACAPPARTAPAPSSRNGGGHPILRSSSAGSSTPPLNGSSLLQSPPQSSRAAASSSSKRKLSVSSEGAFRSPSPHIPRISELRSSGPPVARSGLVSPSSPASPFVPAAAAGRAPLSPSPSPRSSSSSSCSPSSSVSLSSSFSAASSPGGPGFSSPKPSSSSASFTSPRLDRDRKRLRSSSGAASMYDIDQVVVPFSFLHNQPQMPVTPVYKPDIVTPTWHEVPDVPSELLLLGSSPRTPRSGRASRALPFSTPEQPTQRPPPQPAAPATSDSSAPHQRSSLESEAEAPLAAVAPAAAAAGVSAADPGVRRRPQLTVETANNRSSGNDGDVVLLVTSGNGCDGQAAVDPPPPAAASAMVSQDNAGDPPPSLPLEASAAAAGAAAAAAVAVAVVAPTAAVTDACVGGGEAAAAEAAAAGLLPFVRLLAVSGSGGDKAADGALCDAAVSDDDDDGSSDEDTSDEAYCQRHFGCEVLERCRSVCLTTWNLWMHGLFANNCPADVRHSATTVLQSLQASARAAGVDAVPFTPSALGSCSVEQLPLHLFSSAGPFRKRRAPSQGPGDPEREVAKMRRKLSRVRARYLNPPLFTRPESWGEYNEADARVPTYTAADTSSESESDDLRAPARGGRTTREMVFSGSNSNGSGNCEQQQQQPRPVIVPKSRGPGRPRIHPIVPVCKWQVAQLVLENCDKSPCNIIRLRRVVMA